jgi:hypothetical protein
MQKGADVMLKIQSNGDIELTRGDTARLTVSVTDGQKQPYTVQADDVLILTVKKEYADAEPLIEKKITGETTFHIKPEDTAGLAFATYKYDVQIKTADGDNYTVIDDKKFKIANEVG